MLPLNQKFLRLFQAYIEEIGGTGRTDGRTDCRRTDGRGQQHLTRPPTKGHLIIQDTRAFRTRDSSDCKHFVRTLWRFGTTAAWSVLGTIVFVGGSKCRETRSIRLILSCNAVTNLSAYQIILPSVMNAAEIASFKSYNGLAHQSSMPRTCP